ncbi:hypothetical protein KQI65_13905 [bacterium]|nr:hypothetical protein [bacterium]
MKRTLLYTLLGLLLTTAIYAQEADSPEPVFLVVNQNQVDMKDMAALRTMWFERAVPILEEMKKEGLVLNYGLFTHAWGDEWNFNFFFVTKTHEDFLKAWDEYIDRLQAAHPDTFMEWVSKIKSHKDNMYTMYSSPN